MSIRRHRSVCVGIAALALFVAPAMVPPPAPVAQLAPPDGPEACLARALCSLKRRIRARDGSWTPDFCTSLAKGVMAAAERHGVSPGLVTAVMINESDLDEDAVRLSRSRGRVAKDSGLMGIRCVLDAHGRCTNGLVRGMAWKDVMDPLTNVELGARYLALYRHEGGREQITIRSRDDEGELQTRTKSVRCRHRNHAYWAHYNHGTRYISHGEARRYPERVAVLFKALSETLALDAGDLRRSAARGNERSLGARPQKLCALIRETAASCPLLLPGPVGAGAGTIVAAAPATRG